MTAAVNHWAGPDVTVVLCNVEETDELDPAGALRDAVLAETGLPAPNYRSCPAPSGAARPSTSRVSCAMPFIRDMPPATARARAR